MTLAANVGEFSTAAVDGVPAGYVVTRITQGTRDTFGDLTPGASSSVLVDAGIFPFSGKLEVIPAGRSTSNVIRIVTAVPLFTTSPAQECDRINYRGEDYEVFMVDGPFNLDGASLYRSLAARQVRP